MPKWNNNEERIRDYNRAEFIRDSLKPLVYLREDYWNAIQLMANRMGMSQEKYGDLEANYPEPKSAMATAMQRIGMYHASGNTEHLLDAANMLIIEHLFPARDDAYFEAEGSEKSPGLVAKEDEGIFIGLSLILNEANKDANNTESS